MFPITLFADVDTYFKLTINEIEQGLFQIELSAETTDENNKRLLYTQLLAPGHTNETIKIMFRGRVDTTRVQASP
jgi:hypothetical protein